MKNFNTQKILMVLAVVLVAVIVAVGLYFGLGNNDKIGSNKDDNLVAGVIQKVDLTNNNSILESVKSHVVRITNNIGKNKIVGSGFFVEDGYLVTNSHVVDIKGDVTIEYSDGTTSSATLVSNDITSDVAILSVKDVNALAMNFGNTLNVKIANDLYAVGYAANLEGESSITKGILSARRSMAGIEYLQTDAAINSGFSGGPLLNKNGEVVGMNSLSNDNATIGMAISSESLQNIINKLINDNNVSYLESDRPANALSSVLKEVGYEIDDLYDEWEYFHEGEKKPIKDKEEPKKEPIYIPSSNCELKYLGVKGYDIGWGDDPDSIKFQLFFTNNEDKLDLIITPKDSKSTYRVKDNENLSNEVDGAITIIVTAEDGNHKKEYYIVYHNVKSTIEGLKNVNISSAIDRDWRTNTNVLRYSWGFTDADGLSVGVYNKINKLQVELYVCINGEQCTDDSEYVFLKTYNLYQNERYENNVDIKLSDIKQLLNDGNYFVDDKSKIYSKITLFTMNQGSFTSNSYNTISQ